MPLARSVRAERSSHQWSWVAVRGRSARLASEVAKLSKAMLGALALDGTREPLPGGGVDRQLAELRLNGAVGELGDFGLGQQARQLAQYVADRTTETLDVRGVVEPVDDQLARGEALEALVDHLGGKPVGFHDGDEYLG